MNKEKFRLDMQGAIFDLDGTLLNTLEDLKDSVKRGNAIGAIQVMNIGDNEGLPTPKELKAFQEKQ